MFSLSRISKKARGTAAGALAAAGIASAALAAPVLAAPIDSLSAIDGPGHTYQLGGGCAAGLAPASGITLDWMENAGATTVAPAVTGTLCLQKTKGEFRVAIEYFDNTHTQIGVYGSRSSTGNGAALNTFSVSKQGPRVLSSGVNHVHVTIQQRVGGVWTDVGPFRFADYP